MRVHTEMISSLIYIYIYVTVISLLVPLPTHMEATYNTKGLFKTKESRKGKQNGRYGQESEQKVNFLILHYCRELVMTKPSIFRSLPFPY